MHKIINCSKDHMVIGKNTKRTYIYIFEKKIFYCSLFQFFFVSLTTTRHFLFFKFSKISINFINFVRHSHNLTITLHPVYSLIISCSLCAQLPFLTSFSPFQLSLQNFFVSSNKLFFFASLFIIVYNRSFFFFFLRLD
jgi:hypothetical protein